MKVEHVQMYWAERGRLEAIAARLGLDYDEADRDLMGTLRSVDELVGEAGLNPPRTLTGQQPVPRPAPSRAQQPTIGAAATSPGRDMGDIVAEHLAARREGRPVAAWAASKGTAPANAAQSQRIALVPQPGESASTFMQRVRSLSVAGAA